MVDEVFRAAMLRAVQHLPEQRDLTLLVLKGHLLIEQQFYDVLRARLPDVSALENAKLSFWTLARVVRATTGTQAPEAFWTAIDSLHTLRNVLAHHLEPSALETRVANFLGAFPAPFAVPGGNVEDRIKANIAYLIGSLLALLNPNDTMV